MNRLIWKLLRQHISVPQFAGFFLANLVGMIIILLGVQFYCDIQEIYDAEDSFMKADYLIVNKKISAMTNITGQSNAFTDDELEEFADQSFVERLGCFTPSAYDVRASFNVEGMVSFQTEMFFESVPDEFVDVRSNEWTFTPGDETIPIILPKNYLDLYNFGFAQSRNMPKLNEGLLAAIKLQITINRSQQTALPTPGADAPATAHFVGHIVGFSSRLNTILVPESFMQWANSQYASASKPSGVTRIIAEVKDPTDNAITQYLQDNDYETDEGKLNASKTTFILRFIVAIVMGIGLVISILSFYILMLSVYLLVEKNSAKLENLLLLGYSTAKVSLPYQLLTIGLNVLVLVIALVLLMIVRAMYIHSFVAFFPDLVQPSIMPAVCCGIFLLLLVSVFNVLVIYRKIKMILNV